jgi:hypothetical protein
MGFTQALKGPTLKSAERYLGWRCSSSKGQLVDCLGIVVRTLSSAAPSCIHFCYLESWLSMTPSLALKPSGALALLLASIYMRK